MKNLSYQLSINKLNLRTDLSKIGSLRTFFLSCIWLGNTLTSRGFVLLQICVNLKSGSLHFVLFKRVLMVRFTGTSIWWELGRDERPGISHGTVKVFNLKTWTRGIETWHYHL